MANTLSLEALLEMRGRPMLDRGGNEVGSIEEVYYDRDTRVPEWVGVSTSFFGRERVLVPLFEAATDGGSLRVPYDKRTITETPSIKEPEIDESVERRLYDHYGISYSQHTSSSLLPRDVDTSVTDRTEGDRGALHTSSEAMRRHTATRYSWPDERYAPPISGTAERLSSESMADTQGVNVRPETLAPFPTLEPEAARSAENAPASQGDPGTYERAGQSRQVQDRSARADAAPVMTGMPADVPGTLYDTSPDSMRRRRRGGNARNAAFTVGALGAGLMALRWWRRRNRQRRRDGGDND